MEAAEKKTYARLMDKKGGSCIFILSHPFLRAKGRGCVFFRHRRGTFGDALCIKILDRKLYAVPRNQAACVARKILKSY